MTAREPPCRPVWRFYGIGGTGHGDGENGRFCPVSKRNDMRPSKGILRGRKESRIKALAGIFLPAPIDAERQRRSAFLLWAENRGLGGKLV